MSNIKYYSFQPELNYYKSIFLKGTCMQCAKLQCVYIVFYIATSRMHIKIFDLALKSRPEYCLKFSEAIALLPLASLIPGTFADCTLWPVECFLTKEHWIKREGWKRATSALFWPPLSFYRSVLNYIKRFQFCLIVGLFSDRLLCIHTYG